MNKYLKLKTWTGYIAYTLSRKFKRSYSQNAEDLLIRAAARRLKLATHPTYLDIGANHPIFGNNTYLFYTTGSRGVLVEPDTSIWRVLRKTRTRDVCLNVGIGPVADADAPFYIMTSHQLNTFKKEEADAYVAGNNYGRQKIEEVTHVPLVTINSIMKQYFPRGLDILSIDTEGYDLDILRSFDFTTYRPRILCIETLRFDENKHERKQQAIIDYVCSLGYTVYADTFVNTIFVTA